MTHSESEHPAVDAGYSAERFKAFVDAVVAIAITLLILPLMESVSDLAAAGSSTAQWFGAHSSQLVSFLISFGLIAVFWTIHHRVYARVERVTAALLWINIAWLLTIVWFPVATALSGQMPVDDPLARIVYVGSMIATSVLMFAQRAYLWKHPALHRWPADVLRRGSCADAAMVFLFGTALTISLVVPAANYIPLVLLSLTGPIQKLLARSVIRDRSTALRP